MEPDQQGAEQEAMRGRKRRSALLNHMLAYLAAAVVLVPLNFLVSPERVWFYIPLVGWMAPLALHVAYAMGLFDRKGNTGSR